jgi:DNA-binding beta-propeller fold protein YncE
MNMKKLIIIIFLFSSLYSQVYDTLYLPDSLGGCADLYQLIFNPIMDRIYVWSDRSDCLGVLDCTSGERLKPIHSIPPDAQQLTSSRFVYNPNNNYLYVQSIRENNQFNKQPKKECSVDNLSLTATIDSFIYIIDCSTQVIIDTININLVNSYLSSPTAFDINIPANKIYLTWHAYPSTSESTYTEVIDSRINEVIKRFKTLPYIVHHKSRAMAYNYNSGYQANPFSPLYVINCENDTIVDSIPLPQGSDYDKAFLISEIDSLFVFRFDSLLIIDCSNNTIVGRLQFPVRTQYINDFSYNSINNKLYVTTHSLYPNNKVYIVDLNYLQIIDSIVLLYPNSGILIYNPNPNHLYLSESYESTVKVIDGATNQIIDEIPFPYPPCPAVLHPLLNKLYLDDGFNIYIFDCHQRRLVNYFKMSYMNQYIMWQPVTNRLYINDVCRDSFSSILTVYDANTHLPIKVLDLSDYVPPEEWFFHFTTATQVNKIYLTSGHSQGVYVLDGSTDSLINFISCQVGGHYLLYNPNQNKLYTIPFTDFVSPYLYIIDCENDLIRNVINVGQSGNGYFNPYTSKIYATISYEAGAFKVFVIDGVNDTVIRILDSLGLPLCFRNKENNHQVYVGSVFKDCIYVLNAITDSIIDSVMNVPVRAFSDQFFYYDSIDDRIYYPQDYGVLVIDCSNNSIMDTIVSGTIGQPSAYPEENFWDPASNRFYTIYGTLPWQWWINVIDCRTNTVIASSPPLLRPRVMQWNSINNVVYVNDHHASKILAIKDDLISIEEKGSIRNIKELLIYPSIGNKFIIKRKKDEEMTVYDVCGRIVKKIRKEETIIDGKNLTSGVYFIRIDKQKIKDIQKFIVVK